MYTVSQNRQACNPPSVEVFVYTSRLCADKPACPLFVQRHQLSVVSCNLCVGFCTSLSSDEYCTRNRNKQFKLDSIFHIEKVHYLSLVWVF